MSKPRASKYRGLTIRSRGESWQVDFGTRDEKRVQRSFKTKQDAKNGIDAHAEERRLESIDDRNRRVAIFDLTDKQRMDVFSALDVLPEGSTLAEASRFFVKHTKPMGGQRTVSQLLEEYIEEKKKANRRHRTIEDIRSKIGRFAADYGDAPVHQITKQDLVSWMDAHGYREQTRINYRRHLIAFLNFGMRNGYVQSNPASNIERVSVDEKLPKILTPAEAKRLLYAAHEHTARMVPYFAVCLFAGLRPTEVEQLNWRDIDLPKRRIRVRPEVAKKRRQRYVDVSANLAEWLAPHCLESGPVYWGRCDFDKARRIAKLEWSGDVMRHSYGSYHLALNEDAARTALQMGHTSTTVLFTHYRDLVQREDAEAFWCVLPAPAGGVIRIMGA